MDHPVQQLDENQIFDLTGCLAPCEWNEFRHNVRIERWTRHKRYRLYSKKACVTSNILNMIKTNNQIGPMDHTVKRF